MRPEFTHFPKIPRLKRGMIITEKIDGTNGQIYVCPESGEVHAGSRNRWITPDDDNYGFARWVKDHEDELRTGLGHGHHYGEWWGVGIQRGYDLSERRFSLFNYSRWQVGVEGHDPPRCCGVVPKLYAGDFSVDEINNQLELLKTHGSVAKTGFARPEGIVVLHCASGQLFKVLIENDHVPKGNNG